MSESIKDEISEYYSNTSSAVDEVLAKLKEANSQHDEELQSRIDDVVKSIEEIVLAHEPINGIHDLLIHDYGPGRLIISLHAEVPGDHNIYELHEVIDDAEVELAEKLSCLAVIHMDPVDLKNERLQHLKSEIIASLYSCFSSCVIASCNSC